MSRAAVWCIAAAAVFSAQAATISGVVVSGAQPVAHARVFIEPGLGAPLLEAMTGANGAFTFDNVPAGLVGIFAYAEGHSFGGVSRSVGPADTVTDLQIALNTPAQIAGRVTNLKGEPVVGARITRVLLQDSKVGIPLAKLAQKGLAEPQTDAEGRFVVPNLPAGGKVALKVGHPQFAQQGVAGLTAGDNDVRVQLYEGVIVRGSVQSRDSGSPVANAVIVIQTAREPHDTVLTKTDGTGTFSVRLNPNTYLYQSASMELRSPGWEKLVVSGETPSQEVVLRVAGTGRLRGAVRDAVTDKPVAGARVSLAAFGSPAAVVTTGASGTFEFAAVEGENMVRVEPAAGYLKPERPVLTLTVKQGESVDLPIFYLAPLPGYSVRVVDSDKKPVAGAVVRLIRPTQHRWYVTDADGRVSLQVASVPAGNKLVGMVERPTGREGALFSIDMNAAGEAMVQLFPLASVTGEVVTPKEKPLEGVLVGCLFQGDADSEPLPLWRTTTDSGGRFAWQHVVPYVPAACLANAGDERYGRSIPFNAEPGAVQALGRIVVPDEKSGGRKTERVRGMAGKKLTWYEGRVLSGELPPLNELKAGKPAVVVYAASPDAPMLMDALAAARATLKTSRVVYAVVVDGVVSETAEGVVVVQGNNPGPASTYVLDASGAVTLETIGLPPASAIAAVDG